MRATFRDYSDAPGLVDGLLRRADEVSEALREIEGFRAYYLVQTGAGEAISVTVYDGVEGLSGPARLPASGSPGDCPTSRSARPTWLQARPQSAPDRGTVSSGLTRRPVRHR
jgi:hypothetical protein